LTDEMVTARRLVASAAALRTHYTSRQSVVGKVAGRPLPAGAAIPLNALREAHAFKDGERVVVVYASGGLSIRATGIALQPGIIGGTARVRNVDTGVVVSGVVRQDGSVAVGD
jgi:flagella basal body P-ring formation protein FlgA